MLDEIGDKFRLALAFSRAAVNADWDGADLIIEQVESPYDIMVPQAWMLTSVVGYLAQELGLSEDEIWMVVAESIDLSFKDDPDD